MTSWCERDTQRPRALTSEFGESEALDAEREWRVAIGKRHITRAEDWLAMPTVCHSFRLRPFNFFDRNPAIDVPPL